MERQLPKIEKGTYLLMRANARYGKILNKKGEYTNISEHPDSIFYKFNNIEDAKMFIDNDKKKNYTIEYTLFSFDKKVVFQDYSEFEPIEFPKKKSKWWQFWKKE